MLEFDDLREGAPRQAAQFNTTHWSVVVRAAGKSAHATEASTALQILCKTYWFPLYAYVRRRGYSQPDAEDLTQSFFAHLLERNSFAYAAPEKGRFRTFLLSSLKHFLIDEWEKTQTQKRGAGIEFLELDFENGEERFAKAAHEEHDSAEIVFDLDWANDLLVRVFAALQSEYEQQMRAEQFRLLAPFLGGAGALPVYGELAQKTGQSEAALKMMVSRLRQRYREILRGEIAQTVADPGEVEQELQHMISILRHLS